MSKRINDILEFNKEFVKNKQYQNFNTNKMPTNKIAILSCMDTRLVELLPAALNAKNGDVKIIKNAGAIISSPFGSVMRSILIAIYDLEVTEILVIGHFDCGMQQVDSKKLKDKMLKRNIKEEDIDLIKYCGCDLDDWFKTIPDAKVSVSETVKIIKNHPLVPDDVEIYGFVIDPNSGELFDINR